MYERSKIKKQFLNNISEHSELSIVSFLHPRVAYFLDPIEALTTSKGSRIKFFNNTLYFLNFLGDFLHSKLGFSCYYIHASWILHPTHLSVKYMILNHSFKDEMDKTSSVRGFWTPKFINQPILPSLCTLKVASFHFLDLPISKNKYSKKLS